MKPEITLVYDADCPNVRLARAALSDALMRTGLEPGWIECERTTPGVPERFLRFGSPTILVNGSDVAGEPDAAAAACCCVYQTNKGLCGVSPVNAIVAAIERAAVPKRVGGALMTKATASGALGLAFASTLSLLCCLPIATGAFGIGLAAVAAVVSPWWPALSAGSLMLLITAVVQVVRGRGGMKSDRCEVRSHNKRQWFFVGVVGFLTLALLTLPWWSAGITYRLIQ
jgi:hypothetical protein